MTDNDFDNFDDDFDLDDMDNTPASSGDGGNRTFWFLILALGGITLITLVGLVIFALVILPRNRAQRAAYEAQISAENTAVAAAYQQTLEARSWTPTATIIPDTATPMPTSTPVLAVASPTGEGEAPLALAGAQDAARTATVAALLTLAAQTPLAPIATATSYATALPGTGFMDDVDGLSLLIAAAVLIVVMVLARRLRTAGSG